MKIYSLYSFAIAALLIATQFFRTPYAVAGATLNIYVFAIALLHAIFGIWFLKGKESPAFTRASAISRIAIGSTFLVTGAWQYSTVGAASFPLSTYLLLHGTVDLMAGCLTLWHARKQPLAKSETTPMTLEYFNRFLFALYMIGLSSWVLIHAASFVGFFRLPAPVAADGALFPRNALQVFAILLLQLAFFNLVAVKYRIAPLIAAGMRGGMFTCAFVAVLVVLRIVHPVVLLLPAVDLVSVGAIAVSRMRRGRIRN